MGVIDIIILIIIGGFALFGLWFGLVQTVGSLIGMVFGVFLATRYYEPAAALLSRITGWEGNLSRVIMFVIAFLIINRLVGFAFWIVNKFLKIFTSMPFVRSLDRMLGLAFGVVEGLFTVGMIIYFIERFPLSERFMFYLAQSELAPIMVGAVGILLPLAPEALKLIESSVQYVEDAVR